MWSHVWEAVAVVTFVGGLAYVIYRMVTYEDKQ